MKFSVKKSVFFEALNYLKGIIPSSASLPIIQNCYLKVENNILTLIGTDMENTLKIETNIENAENGEVTLPYKFLFETVSNISGDIDLVFELKEEFMNISTEKGEFKIVYSNADSYPMPPKYDEKLKITLEASKLLHIIKKTAFAASLDKTRMNLAGINFRILQKILNVAATDSRRLAYVKSYMDTDVECIFTLPNDTVREVRKLSENYEKVDIILTDEETQVVFRFENILFYSRLLDDEFPDYLKIIPEGFVSKIKVSLEEFKNVMKLARPIANASAIKSVRLRLEEGILYIESAAEEQGKFSSNIKCIEVEGDNIDINFNIDYIYQVLEVCETENIIIEFNGNNRPTAIKEENNEDFIYIVMPIRG